MKVFSPSLTGILLVAFGVGLTLADGVIHGRWTYRWSGKPVERLKAAQRLQDVPDRCGDWETAVSQPLSEYVRSILQCESHINRVYVNRQTGARVQVAVILGPFGPTSTHTPDICYTSRDYRILEERRRVSVPSGETSGSQLWVVTLGSDQLDRDSQRVYYGWSDGGPWKAPGEPRVHFGGRPYLYKIQVAAAVPPGAEEEALDAGQSFLTSFLPQINAYLVRART